MAMALTMSSTVRLNNGVAMPLLGFGTWRIAQEAARQAVQYALQAGYRLLDTAAAYDNEEDVGLGVRESGVDRREIFVTTKVWVSDQHYDDTLRACRQSLRALGMDYLDLYLIHWPAPGLWPESWRALLALLQEEGLCRAIGVSNFEIHHLQELRAISPVMPAVNQVEFSPFLYRKDLLAYCRDHGIQLEAYSPLTRGARLHDPRLQAIAAHYGKTPAQLILRWVMQHEVVVIPKATRREHIRDNIDLYDFVVSPEDMAALDHLHEDFHMLSADWRRQFE